MSEISATFQWLNSALANLGATGGVYRGAAPAGAVGPYVVVTLYGPSDVMGVAGARLWSNNTWLIEVWGYDDGEGTVDTVATAVDTALHQKRNIGVTGGVIVSSVREQARLGFELVGNAMWVHQGGVYRIETRAA